MDSSQSSDPFRGEGQGEHGTEEPVNEVQFDAARWERAGATPEQIAALQEVWDAYPPDEKNQMDAWMHASSDEDLLSWMNEAYPLQAGDPAADANPDAGAGAGAGAVESTSGDANPATPAEPTAQTGAVTPPGSPDPVTAQPPADDGAQTPAPVQSSDQPEAQQPQASTPVETQQPVHPVPESVQEATPQFHNAGQLIEWVGDDKERARRMLDEEHAKPQDEQRKGVLNVMEKVLNS